MVIGWRDSPSVSLLVDEGLESLNVQHTIPILL